MAVYSIGLRSVLHWVTVTHTEVNYWVQSMGLLAVSVDNGSIQYRSTVSITLGYRSHLVQSLGLLAVSVDNGSIHYRSTVSITLGYSYPH